MPQRKQDWKKVFRFSKTKNRRQRKLNRRRSASSAVEQLEARVMFAIDATFSNGALTITGTSSDDTITVSSVLDSGSYYVQVNGNGVGSGVLASEVQSISVSAGDGHDAIDLSAVNASQFTAIGTAADSISLYGGVGDDELVGSDLADSLYGEAGDDSLTGGDGNDSFYTASGSDTLTGNSGDDTYYFTAVNANVGSHTIIEMADFGNDSIQLDTFTSNVTLDLGLTTTQAVSTATNTLSLTLSNGEAIEGVTSGSGDDTLTGNSLDNYLGGGSNHDTLTGGEGDDLIEGFHGNDLMYGELGDDVLTGGPGLDSFYTDSGNDTLTGNNGDDTYYFTTGYSDVGSHTIIEMTDFGTDSIQLDTFTSNVTLDLGLTTTQAVSTATNTLSLTLSDGEAIEGVTSGSGDDTLTGNSLDNYLGGGSNHDRLEGGVGDDLIEGFHGNDEMYGELGSDILTGGPGLDSFYTDSGNDTLTGNNGHDTYHFTAVNANVGSHTIIEMADFGNDSIQLDTFTSNVTLDLGLTTTQAVSTATNTLSLTLSDGAVIENITSGSGNDTLTGNSLDNLLTGGDGNDSFYTASGSDTLTGNSGDDTYYFTTANAAVGSHTVVEGAGQGTDSIQLDTFTSNVTLDLGLTTTQAVSTATNTLSLTLSNGEAIEGVTSGSGDDTLTGNSLDNYLGGGSNHDTLTGGEGDDLIEGFHGNDVMYGELGNDVVTGGPGWDSFYTDSGNDTLTGNNGNDTYHFTTANSNVGSHTIIEMTDFGTDSIQLDTFTSNVTLDLGLTTTQAVSTATNTLSLTLSDGEVMENVTSGSGNDTLTGNSLDNYLGGGSNHDRLEGEAGDDLIEGFHGNDEMHGELGNDTLTGGPGLDSFYTDSGNDILTGNNGHDTYHFTTANPNVGSHTIIEMTDFGTDSIQLDTFTSNVSLDLGLTTTQAVSTATNTLSLTLSDGAVIENITSGSGDDTLAGNSLDNVLTGGDGNDSFYTASGSDTLTGNSGDDTYYFTTANAAVGSHTIVEGAGQGTDSIQLDTFTSNVTLDLGLTTTQAVSTATNTLSLTLSNGEAIEGVTSGSGDDTLTGNSLDNYLGGGSNHDTLIGGAGNDVIEGFHGNDVMYGESGNDALAGGPGWDSFHTDSGNDTLTGHNGNDTYYFSTANAAVGSHTIIEMADFGTDSIQLDTFTSNVTLDLGLTTTQAVSTATNTLSLTLSDGEVMENVTSGSGNDTLTGNSLDNLLTGGDGNDAVFGHQGNDTLDAASGTDALAGNAGDDSYLFSSQDGDVGSFTITEADGEGTDTLDFSAFVHAAPVNGGPTEVQLVGGGSATVALTLAGAMSVEHASPDLIAVGVPDLAVPLGTSALTIDLATAFASGHLAMDETLSYSVTSNSDPVLVGTAIVGDSLQLSFPSDQLGSATLTVKATDGSGHSADMSFTVEVVPPSPQNPINPWDVNNSGYVSNIDTLMVINRLMATDGPAPAPPPGSPPTFYDVNGDGYVTSDDALSVYNKLSASPTWWHHETDVNNDGATTILDRELIEAEIAERTVSDPGSGALPDTELTRQFPTLYWDVNGDGLVTELDLQAFDAQPYLSGAESTPLVFSANSAPQVVSQTIAFVGNDGSSITSATVQIAGNFRQGEDVLNFTDTANITHSWDAATGTLTLSGTATLSEYQAALRAVTYDNTSSTAATGARTITFSVDTATSYRGLLTASRDVIVDRTTALSTSLSYSGDFDGNGLADTLAWDASEQQWQIDRGVAPAEAWAPGSNWIMVRVGDFNGDGRDDLAGFDASLGSWEMDLSREGKFATQENWGRWSAQVTWLNVLVGDFNGDGLDDLAGRDGATGDWQVSLSSGTDLFNSTYEIEAEAFSNRVDGTIDGIIHKWWDINREAAGVGGIGTAVGSHMQVLTAAGTDVATNFGAGDEVAYLEYQVEIPTSGNYDLDLFLAASTAGEETIWVNIPTGTIDHQQGKSWNADYGLVNPVSGTTIQRSNSGIWHLTAGSHTIRVSVGGSGAAVDSLRLRPVTFDDGSSIWSERLVLGTTWSDVLAGDFDGDGKDDLVARNSANHNWTVLRSTGTSFMSQAWGAASQAWSDVEVVDIDRDGKDDLVGTVATNSWRVGQSDGASFVDRAFSNYFNPPQGQPVDYHAKLDAALRAFEQVRNTIDFQPYHGSMKGAQAAADTGQGNAWDQAALLIDNLTTAGIPARFAMGEVTVDASHFDDLRNWLGVKSHVAALNVLLNADLLVSGNVGSSTITFKHAWVQAELPGPNGLAYYDLDPAWKYRDYQDGIADVLAHVDNPFEVVATEDYFDPVSRSYERNFNTNLITGATRTGTTHLDASWKEVSGNFEIVSQKLKAASEGVAVYEAVDAAVIAASALVTAPGAGTKAGVIVRYLDDQNYYWAALERGASASNVVLYRRVDGVDTQLASASAASITSEILSLEAKYRDADGEQLKVYLGSGANRVLKIDFEDNSPSAIRASGKVGVRGSTSATFDDFQANWSERREQLPLEYFEDQVQDYLTDQHPGTSLADVAYSGPIIAAHFDSLPEITDYAASGVTTTTTLSSSDTHRVKIILKQGTTELFSHELVVPEVSLSRITISDGDPAAGLAQPQLRVDGELKAGAAAGIAPDTDVTLSLEHYAPGSSVDLDSKSYVRQAGQYIAIGLDAAQASDAAIVDFRRELQSEYLDLYTTQPADPGEEVVGATLSLALMTYFRNLSEAKARVSQLTHTLRVPVSVGSGLAQSDPAVQYVPQLQEFAVPEEAGVDLPNLRYSGVDLATGDPVSRQDPTFLMLGMQGSALEHDVVESLFAQESVSTSRGLQWAAENDIRVYVLQKVGTSVKDLLTQQTVNIANELQLDSGVESTIAANVNAGSTVTVPKQNVHLNDWEGAVYVDESSIGNGYIIHGDYAANGGYSTTSTSTPQKQPAANNAHVTSYAGDPVNTASGNMFRDDIDVVVPSVGLPIAFARHYDAQGTEDYGMGVGWIYSFGDRLEGIGTDTVEWITSTGQRHKFLKDKAGNYDIPPGLLGGAFQWNGTHYTFTDKHGLKHAFDSAGKLTEIRDRNDNALQMVYASGLLSEVREVFAGQAAQTKLSFTWSNGVIASVSDFSNRTWTYDYQTIVHPEGSKQHLVRSTSPSDADTDAVLVEYGYITSGPLVGLMNEITEPNGGTHEYSYYLNKRSFEVTDATGHSTQMIYDLFRNQSRFVDERGSATIYTYDRQGMPLRTIYADGARTINTWDGDRGLMTSSTDEAGLVETYAEFDADGNLTELVERDGVVTEFTYTTFANVATTTRGTNTAEPRLTTFSYDSNGNRTEMVDPEGNTTSFTYTTGGLLESQTDPKGNLTPLVADDFTTFYEYDDAFRLVAVTEAPTDGGYVYEPGPGPNYSFPTGFDTPATSWELDGPQLHAVDESEGALLIRQQALSAADYTVRATFSFLSDPALASGALALVARYADSSNYLYAELDRWHSDKHHAGVRIVQVENGVEQTLAASLLEIDPLDPLASQLQYDVALHATGDSLSFFVQDKLVLVADGISTSGAGKAGLRMGAGGNAATNTAWVDAFSVAAAPSVTYTYDDRWNRQTMTDAAGIASDYEYDLLNRLISTAVPDPDGNGPLGELVTSTTYGTMGEVLATTDARGNTTTYTYDSKQNLVRVLRPDGTLIQTGYDGARNPVRVTDAAGRVTHSYFDERHRAEVVTHADGATEITRYDGNGRVEAIVDGRGNVTRFSYDEMSRPLSTTDALGQETTNLYDELGQLVKSTDRRGEVTAFAYDDLGRVVTMSGPEGTLSTTEYDAHGNVTRQVRYETDGLNLTTIPSTTTIALDGGLDPASISTARQRVTEFTYDALDRLIEEQDPLQNSSYTTYDAAGQVLTQTDQLGRITRYRYDGLGRLSTEILPDPDGAGPQQSPTTTYAYDESGNVLKTTDALGRVTRFQYDTLNRRTHTTDAAGETSQTLYDAAGQVLVTIDALGRAVTNRYDGRGRLIRQALADPDLNGGQASPVSQWQYDTAGNLIQHTDANGHAVQMVYDALNRKTLETLPLPYSSYTETVDNGDLDYLETWAWADVIGGYGYLGDSRLAASGGESDGAWWVFDVEPGVYRVSATWPVFTNLTQDTKLKVKDGTHVLTEITVDQTQSPSGEHHDSVAWEVLATPHIVSGQLIVELRDGTTNEFSVADAIRIERLYGAAISYQYDENGNLLAETDPLGRVTSYEYDGQGRLTSQTQPDPDGTADPLVAPSTAYRYDSLGQLLEQEDQLGRVTSYTYDELGRRVTLTLPDPDGAAALPAPVTSFGYDDVGNLLTSTDQLGRVTRHEYDDLDRRTRTSLDDGGVDEQQTTYAYDAVGNQVAVTDALGRSTHYEYDALNRRTAVTTADPDGFGPAVAPRTVQQYDAAGNLLASTNALGESTEYAYDRLGRAVAVTDPNGDATLYTYDAVGNLTSVTDPAGNQTRYTYDELNRQTAETITVDAADLSRTFTYDLVGNLTQTTDRNGRTRTFKYDNLNRQTKEWWGDLQSPERAFTRTYDDAGLLGAIRDAEASGMLARYVYVHDALDRVITVSNAGTADAPLTVFDYAYDAVGNRIERSERVEGASAGSVAYEYDRLDRLTRVQESGAAVTDKAVEFSYDAVGKLARLDRYADLNDAEEVLATLYGHDAADRLTRVRHGEAWLPHAYYGYTLDAASRVTDILAPGGTAAFDYDSRGQLTDADHAHQADEAYSYDANGNRTGGGHGTGDHNRLLSDGVYSYQYDGEGNRTRRTEIATGNYVTYEWDYRNRLTSVTFYNAGGAKQKQVLYGYDTADRRLSKSVDTGGDGSFDQTAHYVYDGDDVTLVFDAQGDQTHRYLHGPAVDQILADESALGEVLWPLTDHQGTVREVAQYDLDTDITTIAEEITYNAFGAITSGPTDQTFTYTGREWDADAELYYYRARWYDPTAARFLSPDPSGFDGGDANLYRYVNNSPVTFVDPSGLKVTTPKSSLYSSASEVKTSSSPSFGGSYAPQTDYSQLGSAFSTPGFEEARSVQQVRSHHQAAPEPVRTYQITSIWDSYDQAVQSGAHQPGWFEQYVSVPLAKTLLPASEPTTVTEYADGRKIYTMGGGPSSGALVGQGLSLSGLGGAARGGSAVLAREVAAEVRDTAVQEVFHLPIVPRVGGPRGSVNATVAPEKVPTGQIHHPISTKVGRALDDHPTLSGHYQPRDPRFTTRAIDDAAHRGYQRWHRDLDSEVIRWVDDNPAATPEQFEGWLRWRYSQSDLLERFPNGF